MLSKSPRSCEGYFFPLITNYPPLSKRIRVKLIFGRISVMADQQSAFVVKGLFEFRSYGESSLIITKLPETRIIDANYKLRDKVKDIYVIRFGCHEIPSI